MGVIVPEGEYVATMLFACAGSTKTPTWSFGFRYIGSDPDPAPSDLASLIRIESIRVNSGADAPYVLSDMVTGWQYLGVSVMEMTSTGPLVGQSLVTVTGTQSASPMPINCAILLTKNTANGGRKYKGRAYLPPVSPGENLVDAAGNLTLGTDVALQQAYDAWFNQLNDIDIEPVLHHSDGSIGTKLTSWTIGNTIATQRRRLR